MAKDDMKKKYESPSLEIVGGETNNTENEGGGGNRYSLPYGLCKEADIDTTGMRPRETWEALENNGVVEDVDEEYANFYRELKRKRAKRIRKQV